MAGVLPVRIFRAGTLIATFAHNTSAEGILASKKLELPPAAGVVPSALQERGAASPEVAIQYINGAVPGGDYDVVDQSPPVSRTGQKYRGR
jgi:hypothetical protein